MFPRTNGRLRRNRLPPAQEQAPVAAAAQLQRQQEQQQQQPPQQVPLWQHVPGLRPPPAPGAAAPQVPVLADAGALPARAQPIPLMGGQGQGRWERWEQVPLGIRIMNEICDAISIGSDFAFWSGLIILVIVLVGLMIWYSE